MGKDQAVPPHPGCLERGRRAPDPHPEAETQGRQGKISGPLQGYIRALSLPPAALSAPPGRGSAPHFPPPALRDSCPGPLFQGIIPKKALFLTQIYYACIISLCIFDSTIAVP